MSLAYVKVISVAGPYTLIEFIGMTPGDPPPRPHPWPPEPPVVEPPDPNKPHPSHPIALPGDPWWGTFPPKPNEPPKGKIAVVAPLPPNYVPPAAPPADAAVMAIQLGKDTKPTIAWVAPYADAGLPETPTPTPQ